MTTERALVPIDDDLSGPALPALLAGPGKRGARFLEFFTVNIRNPNTRAIRSPSGKSLGCVVASPPQ